MTKGLREHEMRANSSPLLPLPAPLHNVSSISLFQGCGTNVSRANPDPGVYGIHVITARSEVRSHKCSLGNFVNSSSTNFFYSK